MLKVSASNTEVDRRDFRANGNPSKAFSASWAVAATRFEGRLRIRFTTKNVTK